MINLIKNELIKIFYKKSTYIIFIILFFAVIFTNVLYKKELDEKGNIKSSSYDSGLLKSVEEELKNIEDNSVDNEYILLLRKKLMEYELYEKYGEYSWQGYFIKNNVRNLISEIIDNKYNESNTELLKKLESEYDNYIKKFEEDDWKYFVKEEINKKEEELNMTNSKFLKEIILSEIDMLKYRLDNNISYESSYLNTAIEDYLKYYYSVKYIEYNYILEKDIKDNKLYEYYDNLSKMNINKYILDNKIDSNKMNDTRGILVNLFTEYELFIVLIIVIFSANILSSEFNKGTIKKLLLTPYTKTQIILSKYITCLIMIIFIVLITIIMQLISGGIIFSFSSLDIPVIVYNFNTNMIEEYNIFYYLLITVLAKMPMFIIIMTLVFFISTLTLSNALSIIFGIIIYFISPIVMNLTTKLVKYLIFIHWDFTQYLFGMIPKNSYADIYTSIIMCFLYFSIFLYITNLIFNKKDIKNM